MAFDGTLKFDTAIDKSGFEAGLDKLGSIAKSGMAVVTGAVAAAGAGMAALGAEAFDLYADYEQLVGGVETLFGAGGKSVEEYADSVGKSVDAVRKDYDGLIAAQSAVMQNAAVAFRTAGMSQNDYMETVTSFSAALIASLGGDTEKAAAVADKAIIDMSDNANKMGTDIENIQNAYQGFAKQNYTMLDNLKLGYGGTKSEMERLLADAEKLSGMHFELESYADIVEAIHVIQTEMGITGTTSKEAASTISGSLSMTKAAWDNLLVGVADDTQDFDKLTNDLVASVETAAGNILPRIETIGGGLIDLISGLSDDAVKLVTDAAQYVPDLADLGIELVSAVADGIADNAPELADTAILAGLRLVDGIGDILEKMPEIGESLLTGLIDGMERRANLAAFVGQTLMERIIPAITENLGGMLEAGAELIKMLLTGIRDAVPKLLTIAKTILQTVAKALIDNLPELLVLGGEIIGELVLGLIEALPEIVGVAVALLTMLADFISDNLDPLLSAAAVIITAIGEALLDPSMLASIIEVAGKLLTAIIEGLTGDGIGELQHAVLGLVPVIIDTLLDPELIGQLAETGALLVAELVKGMCVLGETSAGEFVLLVEEIGRVLGEQDWAALGMALINGVLDGAGSVDFDAFWDNWFSGLEDIKTFFSDVKTSCEEGWKNITDWASETWTNAKISVGSFIADLVTKGEEGAADLKQKIVDGLQKLPEDMLSIGKDIVTGLGNGILSMGEWLGGKISGFADDILGWFKDPLGIQSPSRLMRDMIGKNLALGIGVGFEVEMPGVGDDVQKATEQALPDITETIVPVVDVAKPEMKLPEQSELSQTLMQQIEYKNNDIPEPELPDLVQAVTQEIRYKNEDPETPDLPALAQSIIREISYKQQEPDVPELSALAWDIEQPELRRPELPALPDLVQMIRQEVVPAENELPAVAWQLADIPKPELPDLTQTIVPEIDMTDLLRTAYELPAIKQDVIREADNRLPEISPEAVELMRKAPRYAMPIEPAATSQIINNYNSYETTNNSTTAAAPEQPQQTGDIIIPVSIGGEHLDTVVVKALQTANAMSGGATM